jgi:hypothetical protein
MNIHTYILSLLGQIAIASTVFVSSFSSTALLQIVAHPYVSHLYEIIPDYEDSNDDQSKLIDSNDHEAVISYSNTSPTSTTTTSTSTSTTTSNKDSLSRRFIAIRYNILGNDIRTEFTLRDASRNVSNPFASFQVKAMNSSSSSTNSGTSSSGSSIKGSVGYFYIFGGDMTDNVLKNALTKENY